MIGNIKNRQLITRATDLSRNPFTYVFLASTIGIFRGLQSRFIGQNGDAAGYVDALSPGQAFLNLNFAYGFSVIKLRELIGINPIDLQAISFYNNYADISFMHSHPYLISFIFRMLPTFTLPIYFFPLMLLAVSYSLGVTLLLRRTFQAQLNLWPKTFLGLILLASPILTEAISGQPYFDKLFFGPCIAIIFILTSGDLSRRQNQIILFFLLLLSITLSERTALMSSIITLYLLGIRFGIKLLKHKFNVAIATLAIFGLSWFLVWSTYLSKNPDMANLNFENYWANLVSALGGDRRSNFIVFALNIAPFLFLTLMKISFLPACILGIMPNLIVSIGGAELTGYSTHYHSIYLPIIFALGIVSITQFTEKDQYRKRSVVLICAVMAFLLSLSSSLNGKLNFQDLNAKAGQVLTSAFDSFGLIPRDVIDARNSRSIEYRNLYSGLDSNSNMRISAPEQFMPSLVERGLRKIDYFPVGLGFNELLIVPFTDDTYSTVEISLYGLVSEEDQLIWSSTILRILNSRYVETKRYTGVLGHVIIYELENP